MRMVCVAVLVVLKCSNESKASSKTYFNITIEPGPNFGAFLPGSSATIDCLARCSDRIRCRVAWYFNGSRVHFPSERLRFFHNGSLQILEFNAHDEGEYLCVVTSRPYARISQIAFLQLAVIQRETQTVVDEFATAGNNVLLPCYVGGVPKPSVMWTKHSNNDYFTGSAISSAATESNSLQIMNITLKDEGLYKCHASNMAGKVVAAVFAVNVSLQDVPRPIRQLSKIRLLDAMLGEPVSLECLWSSSDSVWYRGAVRLVNFITVGGSLFIESVSFEDAGTYTCRSSKDFSITMDVTLVVYALPSLLSKREVHFKVALGSEIQLTSFYTGYPIPKAKWFKNSKPLRENKSRMNVLDVNQTRVMQYSRLTVSNSTLSDFGLYQCLIRNRFGVVEATHFVYVLVQVGAPENVRARIVKDGEIEVSWEPPSDLEGPALYTVYYYSEYDPSEKWMTTSQTRIKLIHLRPFTNYTFYVKAESDGETSAPSDFVSQMTNEEEFYFPEELEAEAMNETSVMITWKVGRIHKDVDLHGYVFQYRDHRNKTFWEFVRYPRMSVVLNNLVPGHSYEVITHSMSKLGPGMPTSLNVNILELLKDLNSPTMTDYLSDGIFVLKPESSSSTEGPKTIEISHSTENIKFQTAVKHLKSSLTKQKGNVLNTTKSSKTHSTENSLRPILQAVALNDTTILVSFSSSPKVLETESLSICFGINETRDLATCIPTQWGDLSRDTIYVNNLCPMTKYYFGICDDKKWLGNLITCLTELPIPTDLKYSPVGENKLLITWNIPETTDNDFLFRVSYNALTDGSQTEWLHYYIEGSVTYYIIENYVSDWNYVVEIKSAKDGLVNAKGGMLHVEAHREEKTMNIHPDVSVTRISILAIAIVAAVVIFVPVVYVVAIRRRQLDSNPMNGSTMDDVVSSKSPQVSLELKSIKESGDGHKHSYV